MVRDIDSGVTFSPDSLRIAYVRQNNPDVGKYRILSANVDGKDEKVLQIGDTASPPNDLAWSPDGKTIAYSRYQPDNLMSGVVSGVDLMDLKSSKVQVLGRYRDQSVTDLRWVPDGHALLVLYQDLSTRWQIGSISYPAGQFKPVTRDTNGYVAPTLSADGKSLATVQAKTTQRLFVIPRSGKQDTPARLVLSQSSSPNFGFNWARGGKLLISAVDALVRIDSMGNDRTTLLSDAFINMPSTCGTRYLVFSLWTQNGMHIWRTDPDGSNKMQLTDGKRDLYPTCSPDSKWVYYLNAGGDQTQVWRAPLNGGGKPEPEPGSIVPNSLIGDFSRR